jgi:creatinine amidohydrolase
MLWHEMSWPQIQSADRNLPVVVPLGSCEQHGHHLPVMVDTLQVETIARDVESALRDRMLLTQTLWLGSSHHHKDFPGTLSVTPILYAQVIRQIAESVLNAGFKRLFFLNGHGGNRVPAGAALAELIATDDRADESHIALASWWEVAASAMPEAGMAQPVLGHACEFETSLMLEIRADLVHMDRIQPPSNAIDNDWFRSESDAGKRVSLYHRFHRISSAGPLGNPAAATREKGQRLRGGVVREITRFISDFSTWPLTRKLGPQ